MPQEGESVVVSETPFNRIPYRTVSLHNSSDRQHEIEEKT